MCVCVRASVGVVTGLKSNGAKRSQMISGAQRSSLCILYNFCINPFPRHWAGGTAWLPGTVEVRETTNWKELNLNKSKS